MVYGLHFYHLNSNLTADGLAIDPNLVQTNFAIVNGWDTNVTNVPPNFSGFGILITIWVWRGDYTLTGTRCQTLIYSGFVAYRHYYDTWVDWNVIR